jgi:uncharacterized damage-inducible protein DinB
MAVDLHSVVFTGFDYVYARLRDRIADLDDTEYRWEPVPQMWTVREQDAEWVADWAQPDPDPAPLTTIAWRIWHIADCLASYVAPHLGEWPLPGEFRDWCGDAATARSHLATAHDAFRERITERGADFLSTPLGEKWGPFAKDTWAHLVIHAMDEVAHHGAEVALLRDLYRTDRRRGSTVAACVS